MADIEVELPGGLVIVFPEGTAPEKIREVSRRAVGTMSAQEQPNRWHTAAETIVHDRQVTQAPGPGFR